MLWLFAAFAAVAVTVILVLPASWMTGIVEERTGGRITLGDAQGSIWRGSAFIGAASSGQDPVTPLLPGRFSWRLSPAALFGVVDAVLENPEALTQAVIVTGSWSDWTIGPSIIRMPASRLVALGAPLNTLAPSGDMRLSWTELQLHRRDRQFDLMGSMQLDLENIASRLSPIKPLGAYRIRMDWEGQKAQMLVTTMQGPLVLTGSGNLSSGRFRFSGRAQAAPGESRLANLLNLLGQRRREGTTDFIALEFN